MKRAFFGAGLALLANASFAENNFDDRWYVTPGVNYVIPDSDKNASSALAAGIGLGKFLTDKISLDFELDRTTLDLSNEDELEQNTFGFMGRYHFNENSGFRPYVGLGLGWMTSKMTGYDKDRNGIGSVALGINKALSDNINLRTEAKYRYENSDKNITGEDSYGDIVLGAGITYLIGESNAPSTKTQLVEQQPQVDSDGDGVSDANDQCPNTPAGTEVDANGCGKVDGDDDNDGVANSMDACPNSKSGAVVGKDGCEVQVVIELQGVHFDTDKATLKPESVAILNAAVKTLGEHGTIMVEVAGHTDSTASEAYNQDLSERRAKVVFDYLVNHGVSADRMTWKGYGELQPIATNDTEEGKARNRRTELNVK